MRPVAAAVGSGSLTSLAIAVARELLWVDSSQGISVPSPSLPDYPPFRELVASEWRLDFYSLSLGILVGLSLGPLLDLLFFLRISWTRFVHQVLRAGATRQLYRVLG